MPAGTPGATPPAERRGAGATPRGAHPRGRLARTRLPRNEIPRPNRGRGRRRLPRRAAERTCLPGGRLVDRNARRRWSGRGLRRGAIEGRHLLGGLLVARCSGSGAGLGHRRIRLPRHVPAQRPVRRSSRVVSVGRIIRAHHVSPSSRSAIPPLAAPGVVSRAGRIQFRTTRTRRCAPKPVGRPSCTASGAPRGAPG